MIRLPLVDDAGERPRPDQLQAPWRPEELMRWLVLSGVALALCVTAWYLAAGQKNPTSQVGPVNLGIVALVVATSGNVSLILAGRRATGERRRSLLGEPCATQATDETSGASHHPVSDVLIGLDGLRYYHRSDCRLAHQRPWPVAYRATHEGAGRLPCAVCQP